LFCRTFREYNKTAEIIIYKDILFENNKNKTVPTIFHAFGEKTHSFYEGVRMMPIEQDEFLNRRCLCRLKKQVDEITGNACWKETKEKFLLSTGDRIIFADADLVFLDDPFKCFDRMKTDVGLTTRMTNYHWPVNGGFSAWVVSSETQNVWTTFLDTFLEKYQGDKDWNIDQDFLCWLYTEKLISYDDLGWNWNFCPGKDVFGSELVEQMYRRAYESKSVKVIHLKDQSKNLMEIFDDANRMGL